MATESNFNSIENIIRKRAESELQQEIALLGDFNWKKANIHRVKIGDLKKRLDNIHDEHFIGDALANGWIDGVFQKVQDEIIDERTEELINSMVNIILGE